MVDSQVVLNGQTFAYTSLCNCNYPVDALVWITGLQSPEKPTKLVLHFSTLL